MGRLSAQVGVMGAQGRGDWAGTGGLSSPPPAAIEEENYGSHRVTLAFRSSAVEGEYMAGEASSRWRVLALVASFDCVMFVVRGTAKLLSGAAIGHSLPTQLANMVLLYSLIALLNSRSRRLGSRAAHQEEALLCCLIATAISFLLLSLRPGNSSDYVYAALFLTCTSSILKLRWFVGTIALAVPVAVAAITNLHLHFAAGTCAAGNLSSGACVAADAAAAAGGSAHLLQLVHVGPLPVEALVHILVAWAVGALMAFVADSNRRQTFVSHRQALGAAAKELAEVQARVLMERELAAAQQQAAARALIVAKEKASNEAKSEFMSLMCHEVRTPLNGCLASAEMLLDTELDEDQRELAKTIRVSGSILLSTVSNFLDFFKIEAGKQLDIVRSPLDLRDLVTDVHCIIEAMVGRERGIVLLPPDLDGAPATVLGDPSRICGILLNLYTNAAKYTKRGSIALRVREVGRNYRPDPTAALGFCKHNSGVDSRASRSFLASMADTAPNTSGQSTPTGVLSGGPGGGGAGGSGSRAADPFGGGKPGSSSAAAHAAAAAHRGASPQTLYRQGSRLGHGTAASLQQAAGVSSSAAADAAVLLSRQAEAARAGVAHTIMSSVTEIDGWSSVHSQADPHFVMRHARSGQLSNLSAASTRASASSGEEDEGEPRFLCFEVMDTGVGVSHKALESLFQDYVQGTDAEMQRPRPRGGTGLGLSICCKQVSVLGGAIGALSKPACGSVFWFTTPLLLPGRSSSSLESGSEEQAAAKAAADEAAPRTAASHAAGVAAIRRSMDFAAAALVAPAPGGDGESAVLPHGIPMGHSHHSVRQRSSSDSRVDLRGVGGGSGSRRQSMDSNLSSMWPSHKMLPPQLAHSRLDEMAEEASSYHPRHALSWEQQAMQPPSFTAAEMLQAMPLLSSFTSSSTRRIEPASSGGQVAQPRRSLTSRTSLSGPVVHLGGTAGTAAPGRASLSGPIASCSTAAAATAAAAGGASASAAAAARQRQSSSLLGLSVLLAEDNLINQTVAKRVLTSLGCECRVASNGREAVMAVEEAALGGPQFDVILMDMCMPVLGGVEATQEIRQLGSRVPIVAMTANVSERDRVECIAAGMDGFLCKPVLKEQLSVAIREATQGRQRA